MTATKTAPKKQATKKGVNEKRIRAQLKKEATAAAKGFKVAFSATSVDMDAINEGIDRLATDLIESMGQPWKKTSAATKVYDLLFSSRPESEWWATPLGMACASCFDEASPISVRYIDAAVALDIKRGTVSSLIARGNLIVRSDGSGVIPSTIFAYDQQRTRTG